MSELPLNQFAANGSLPLLSSIQQKVDSSNICIGLRSLQGVVLAVEEDELCPWGRILSVEGRIGVAASGTPQVGQRLIDIAASECSTYKSNFGVELSLAALQARLASYIHGFTISSATQPLDTNLLCASCEPCGPLLYALLPSGESRGCVGFVSGVSGREKDTAIQRLNSQTLSRLTLTELAKEATVLAYLANGKVRTELKLGLVGESTGLKFELASPQLLAECHAHANMVMIMLGRCK